MKKIIALLALLLFTVGATQLNAQLLDRSGWTITTSSEGYETATSGHGSTIIDGDISTYWHSYWSGMGDASGYLTPELPQFFVIDMGSEQTFKTIGYIPRPLANNDYGNGTAYSWKLYVSNSAFASTDASTAPSTIVDALGEPAMSGTWTYDNFDPSKQIQTATADNELSGRYVMFVITSAKGDKFGSCAEFFLSKAESIDYPFETVTYGSSFEDNQAISLSSTPATTLKTNQWYAIKNNTKGFWQDQQSGAWKTVSSASSSSIDKQKANDKAGFLFKLEDAGDGKYNIISGNGISLSLVLTGWGSSSAEVTKPFKAFTIAQIGDNEGYFYIQQASNSAIADGNGSVVGWGTTPPTGISGNNVHLFYEATLYELQDYHITPANDKVYTISTASRGNWAYDPAFVNGDFKGTDALISTGVEGASITADNQKYFAILKSDKGNYYIYSVAGQKFLSTNNSYVPLSVAPTTSGTELIDNVTNCNDYPYVVAIDGYQIAISNGYATRGGLISDYNELTDEGNQVRITEVEGETADVAVALARIALFEGMSTTYNIGSAYGQYTDPSNAYTNALTAAQTLIADAEATAGGLGSALTTLTSAAAALTLNVPADGAFIRIKSHNSSSAYLANENTTTSGKETRAAYSTETDGTTIFCYKDGCLVNYNSGLYLVNNSNHAGYNGVQTAGSKVTFVKNADVTATGAGAYYVNFTGNNDATRHLYAQDDNYADAGSGTPDNVRYTFDLEAVASLPVTIGEAGYATIYAPAALQVAEGVTAYTAEVADGKVTLTEISSGVIPANTGVVLAGAANTYDLTLTTTDETASSDLTGNIPSVTFASGDNPYILYKGNEGVGFYEMNSTTDRTVHGFRAFYKSSEATPGTSAFIISVGKETGIGSVISSQLDSNAPIYDLSGRRVVKMQQGIYIQNGKKVYVK